VIWWMYCCHSKLHYCVQTAATLNSTMLNKIRQFHGPQPPVVVPAIATYLCFICVGAVPSSVVCTARSSEQYSSFCTLCWGAIHWPNEAVHVEFKTIATCCSLIHLPHTPLTHLFHTSLSHLPPTSLTQFYESTRPKASSGQSTAMH
jgi:hypothetical protein